MSETIFVWFEPTILTQGFIVVNNLILQHPEVNVRAAIQYSKDPVVKLKESELVYKQLHFLAESVEFDPHDHDSVDQGLANINRAVLIPPNTENKGKDGVAVVEGLKRNKVDFVLLFSMLGADFDSMPVDPRIELQKQYREIELAVEKSRIRHTFLRSPGFYFEYLALYQQLFKEKSEFQLCFGPRDAVRTGPIMGIDDVAQSVIAVLFTKDRRVGRSYWITGPIDQSAHMMAESLSKATGKLLPYKQVSKEENEVLFRKIGFRPYEAHAFAELLNYLSTSPVAAKVTSDTAALIGRRLDTFDHWVNAHLERHCGPIEGFVLWISDYFGHEKDKLMRG